MPAADAGVPDPGAGGRDIAPVMVPCTMVPTAEKYCKLMDIACKADADCPNLFTCRQSAIMTAPLPPAGTCFVPPDGGTCGGGTWAPPPPVYRCVPPYETISVESVSDGYKTDPGVPTMMPNTAPANPMTTNPPPPIGPRPGTAMTPNPDPGTLPGGFTPTAPNAEGSEAPAASHKVKACMVTAPGAGTGGSVLWVTLTALLCVSLRRRRRA
jgi:hypothetical protein